TSPDVSVCLCMYMCLCLCGFSVSECVTSVQSKRREVFMPEGSSVSLVCKILHCGQEGWRGAWRFTAKGHSTLLIPSARHHVSNYTENANSINLLVTVQSLNQSDSGAYQCYVKWKNNLTSAGHVTYVNVTTVDPESGRRLYHRLLVCGAAGLCLFLVLGLTCCTSSSQRLAPPVPLRRRGPRKIPLSCHQPLVTSHNNLAEMLQAYVPLFFTA
uniref:Ig-like domain-containing protein n=1 Tax=Electrophorus electricus TaxID=8005 RepID=A0A4W4H3J1_ELEEL